MPNPELTKKFEKHSHVADRIKQRHTELLNKAQETAQNRTLEEKSKEYEHAGQEIQQHLEQVKRGGDYASVMNAIIMTTTLLWLQDINKTWDLRGASKEAAKDLVKTLDDASPYYIDMKADGTIDQALIFDSKNPKDTQAQENIRDTFIQTLEAWAGKNPRNWTVQTQNNSGNVEVFFQKPDGSKVDRDTFNAAKNDPQSGLHIDLKNSLGNIKLYDMSKNQSPSQQNFFANPPPAMGP